VDESNQYEVFLKGLLSSGLVGAAFISKIKEEHQATCGPHLTIEERLRDLGIKLTGNAVLTHWQCGMIKRGKYQGFFIGNYEIRDFIGVKRERRDVQAYLARDVRDPTLEVVLEFEHFQEQVKCGRELKFSITFERRIVSNSTSEEVGQIVG
jgi:hypothetical protein